MTRALDWFSSGGFIMWPLLALAAGVIWMAGRAALAIHRGEGGDADRRALALPLFWGAMALLVGTLGTVGGVVVMARRIAAVGGASPSLIWGGVAVTLVSLAFGIMIFLLSGILWLALDGWQRLRARRAGRVASAGLLVALAGLAAGCSEGGDPGFVVQDSAGVRVVTNAGPDRPYPGVVARITTLQPPDSALTAMPWGVVADPEAGLVFVADATSQRVVVFDGGGAFVRSMGRSGGGPGEFRAATAVALDDAGTLAVWDARRGVISRWSGSGELLGEDAAPVRYWGPGFAFRSGGLLAVTQTTTGDRRRQSLVEVPWGTAGRGPRRSEETPRELLAVTRDLVAVELAGTRMPAPRIFAPDLVWASRGDTALVLNGPGYRIDAHAGGRLVASVRRDVGPLDVTEEMAAARVQAGPYRGFMRRAGLTAGQIVEAVGYEEVTAPVAWIAVDPAGTRWVARASERPVPDRVDLLDAEGRYLGTLDAPGLPVAFLSDARFVALEVTDLGRPTLGLYRLTREAADGDGRIPGSEAW